MNISTNREERSLQKKILKDLFFDYDAKHHDAYVIRYNKLFDDKMLHNYMVERGLISQFEQFSPYGEKDKIVIVKEEK